MTKKFKRQQFLIKTHHKIDEKLSRQRCLDPDPVLKNSWIRFVLRGGSESGQYQTGSATLIATKVLGSVTTPLHKEPLVALACQGLSRHLHIQQRVHLFSPVPGTSFRRSVQTIFISCREKRAGWGLRRDMIMTKQSIMFSNCD